MNWLDQGWQVFPAEPQVTAWVEALRAPILAQVAGDRGSARHGGTWYPGVDAIPNDALGRAFGGPSFTGQALYRAEAVMGAMSLHPGQLSITYPGYPKQDEGESDAAHRFRLNRDAAHLDGLLPIGPERRRFLREPHAYILGVALTEAEAGAAPLVVYENSHEVMRAAFRDLFNGHPPDTWSEIDVTDVYQGARRHCFEICPRRELPLQPGQAVLLHRLTLHGVAPWAAGAEAAQEGRAVAYFRPCLEEFSDWLERP